MIESGPASDGLMCLKRWILFSESVSEKLRFVSESFSFTYA